MCDAETKSIGYAAGLLSLGTVSFVFNFCSYLCTMKTLIIGYELNNITIKINLATNCKTCVRLVQQQILQLYLSFLIGFKSFIIARMINFFLYYVLSKKKLKKKSKIRILTGVNLTPLLQNAHFFTGRQRVKHLIEILLL